MSGLNECPENLRRNTFVLSLGAEGYRICMSRPGLKDTMEDLIDAVAKHYKPASSLTRERPTLLHMKHGTENVEAYATRLRLAMGNCQLAELEDDLTRVVFIGGLTSDLMMERLLEAQKARSSRRWRGPRQCKTDCHEQASRTVAPSDVSLPTANDLRR